jgi:hypothetical protein
MSTCGQRENVRLAAAELANVEMLMETTRPVTLVVPLTDEERDEEEGDDPGNTETLLKLQVYAPMYTALIDPPYELPPKVVALQAELFTLLMDTFTPLAAVSADSLLLVFVPEVQAYPYPPRYTENDPPYTCPKTLHQRATHAQRQYDRGGDDHKRTDIGAH